MKRRDTLVPLSQDHHNGLLLATRLQQGTKALLHLWSHDPRWQARHVVEFYETHLVPHFTLEERALFPVARRYVGAHARVIDRLIAEHGTMRTTIEVFRHPEDQRLPRELAEFGRLLEGHIRCEERELFPLCEALIPEEGWKRIEDEMRRS